MTYYLDDDCRVHTAPGEGRTPWEDADGVFAGKCKAYTEGFRVVPEGQTWVRGDGMAFPGLMVAPWKPYAELDAVQRQYEREQYEAMKAAVEEAQAAQAAYEQGVQEA